MADQRGEHADLIPRFEGYELPPFLGVDEICALMHGKVAKGKVMRWFRAGELHGFKPGKAWVIRASQFLEDIKVLEHGGVPELAPERAIRLRRREPRQLGGRVGDAGTAERAGGAN